MLRCASLVLVSASLLTLATPLPVQAFQACPACVRMDTVVTLDFTETRTSPSPGGHLAQGGVQDRWVFVDPNVSHEVLVFRSSGEYETTLGRQGEGPGEYRPGPLGISGLVFDSSDTLWVFSQRGRYVDLYGPDLRWARGMTLELAVRAAAPLSGGRVVAVVAAPAGAQLGYLDRAGGFQLLSAPRLAGADAALVPLTSDGVRRFWVAEPHGYLVWEVRIGEPPRQLTGAVPPWFDETFSEALRAEFGAMLDARGATILSLRFDRARDVVWLTAGIPSRTLQPSALRTAAQGQVVGSAVARLLVDHIVQGLRVGSGSAVGVARFDYLSLTPSSAEQYEVSGTDRVEVLRPLTRTSSP